MRYLLFTSLLICHLALVIFQTTSSTDIPDPCEPPSLVTFLQTKKDVNYFNKDMLSPKIEHLISLDYFRYVKVNLSRPCELWCDTSKCILEDCRVEVLSDPSRCPVSSTNDTNDNIELSTVNRKLASDQLEELTKLFECNDDDDHDPQYVDLHINPERYTGYSGESAQRVWRTIYEENCFVKGSQNPFSPNLCYEERLFYEAISGLHSSINIHLCAEYPFNRLTGTFEPNVGERLRIFKPNVDEFLRRFDGRYDYLENLYTLFLLELKALTVAENYLTKKVNWQNSSTRDAVHELLIVANKLNMPKFKELSLKPSRVSHELASHFRNITTSIMDCVGCDKCKLWGKVQLRGLGAAFKILSVKQLDELNLHHQEIVSLINAIARLSHSIRQLETFIDLYISANDSEYGVR